MEFLSNRLMFDVNETEQDDSGDLELTKTYKQEMYAENNLTIE